MHTTTSNVRDGFDRHLTEKLWEMIPAVYRHEDGLAENPDVLRALVEILGRQAAIVRRSQDRLWDDEFIEVCDDWAVPYLADLVGTRLVSALNPRGRRIDVAKTIYYRRRKGTPCVLEELISDIARWEGKVVENFRRLARTHHRLDPAPRQYSGRITRTQPGGWADLGSARTGELVGGAFDEFHYTPDVRRHRGRRGRYSIPKITFHVFRRRAFGLAGVDPVDLSMPSEARFTLDPSGRNVPLFTRPPDYGENWRRDPWVAAREWDVPGPIDCRVLGHVEFQITEKALADLRDAMVITDSQADELRPLKGWRYAGERAFILALESYNDGSPIDHRAVMAACLVEDCGKSVLVPKSVSISDALTSEFGPNDVVAGNLDSWDRVPPPGTRAVIDPERGRFRLSGTPADPITVTYHYGWPGELGACPIDRREAERGVPDENWSNGIPAALPQRGILQIDDNRTYPLPAGTVVELDGDLTVRAANQMRPYVAMDEFISFAVDPAVTPERDISLIIDGIWFGGGGELRIAGDFERVLLRHVTLDPGGKDATNVDITPTRLVITGHVEALEIERSITSSILMSGAGHVERMRISDSIVHAWDTEDAIWSPRTDLEIKGVTVFGKIAARRLSASELIATEPPVLADTQNGCFRFSAAPEGSRLPRPYEHFELPYPGWHHFFISRAFGDPHFARLSENAPTALRSGGEHGLEMGAFNADLEPVRLQSLKTKAEEYMPFGLIPLFVNET